MSMTIEPRARTRRVLLTALVLSLLVGCRGLDFGANPGKEVSKTDGQLTAYPSHLRDGSRE